MTFPAVVALFPEASYGAALNCVGIAQELRQMGAHPVFICHPGFAGVFAEYGFQEHHLGDTLQAQPADWNDFIARHRDAFRQSPLGQLDSYVGPTWDAIVDTAVRVEEPLGKLLARIRPDVVVLDNVVMFPAIAKAGVPWVRVVSCAETELPDDDIPPYLSGAGLAARSNWTAFTAQYLSVTRRAHQRFSAFLGDCGLKAPSHPSFLDPSPWLNLVLAPGLIRYRRRAPLDAGRFVFLEGCVRRDAPFTVPRFASHDDAPLVLTSFGSLGAMDVDLIERMISVFAKLPYRFLVNVGSWRHAYREIPDNVFIDSWFPQPSVVEQVALFIHHGGNNSFCEALYYGVPSLVMPYCWDGHDNAARAVETGVGEGLERYGWSDTQLAAAVERLVSDKSMRNRLKANARTMQAANGARLAARRILDLAELAAGKSTATISRA
jgi:MGT family glycosyltransferase